jgi:serine/threonine protein kinase
MKPIEKFACRHCGRRVSAAHIPALTEVPCPVCGATIMAQARLGAYVLTHRAGQGAMGVVFHATDEMLARSVAIKILYLDPVHEREQYETLLAEARAAAALSHPRIVAVHAFGQDGGRPYLVMEWVPGGSLAERIADGRALPEVEALRVATSAFRGLEQCHQRGMIHGDIKPGNLLFDEEGEVKLADFGISHFRTQPREDQLKGTPLYVAPEKAVAQMEDQRSDFYSMGVVLWEMLAGRPPFDGDEATEIIEKRIGSPPPDLRQVVPGVSADTAILIRRLLEPNPARRVANYAALNMLLFRAQEGARRSHGRSAPPPPPEGSAPPPKPGNAATRGLRRLMGLLDNS